MRKTSRYARKRRSAPAQLPPTALEVLTRAHVMGTPLDPDQARDIAIIYHGSLGDLTQGRADEQALNNLAVCVNMAMMLCQVELGREYLPDVLAAQDAVVAIRQRVRPIATGPELKALTTVVELHDAQLEHPDCTAAVLKAAMAEIRRRRDAGDVL